MNFSIPRKNPSEMLLYVWKIIDLPSINEDDLLYTISFELFLFSPQKARDFIQSSINNNLLKRDEYQNLSLSKSLKKNLESWQINRKEAISAKLKAKEENIKVLHKFQSDKTTTFKTLLNAFLDKGTINRTASLSEEDFNIIEFDPKTGNIKAEVQGSQKEQYIIKIDTTKRILIHNCQDFETKRLKNKKFCKHLAKIFLILKEKNEESITNILREIATNVNDWEFTS